MFFWMYLPSLTNLSNVFVRLHAVSGTDYQQYNKTTDISGNSFSTGFNLISINLATDSSSASGNGWTPQQSFTRVEIGVTTSSSGQSYTGLGVDGVMFGYYRYNDYNANDYAEKGEEFTIYDGTNLETFQISSASTLQQGIVTIASALSNSYVAGSATIIERNMLTYTTDSTTGLPVAGFTSGLTGNALKSQDFRIKRHLSKALPGTLLRGLLF
jgi:hypothetical protein